MKHVNVALFAVHGGCPHMCSFCNQKSISGSEGNLKKEDIDSAVHTALRNSPEGFGNSGEIAFFGGSFTLMNREYMVSLLESAYFYVREGLFKGIRISTRPDGIDPEICSLLKTYGVTAVELGAQSLDNRVLAANNRGHSAESVVTATLTLKESGFETGLQMMTGLYLSEDEDSIETAEKIIALKPDTVRIYPTVVLEGTELDRLMKAGLFIPKGVEESAALCAKLIPMFENSGIKVIRVGLHSGGGVEGKMTGGAYHPAFRELCDAKIYLEKAMSLFKDMPRGSYEISVARGEKSKMTGQKRQNIVYLQSLGYICRVSEDEGTVKYDIKIRKCDDIKRT